MLQPTVKNLENGALKSLEACCHIPSLKEQHRPGEIKRNCFLEASNVLKSLIWFILAQMAQKYSGNNGEWYFPLRLSHFTYIHYQM